MNINDIVTVAMEAMPVAGVTHLLRGNIEGVLSMAVRLAVKQIQIEKDNSDTEWAAHVVNARRERDEARRELEAMTAARDAAVARSEALAKELGELRTNGVSVTGAT